jgi:hypothetical protein
MRRLRPRFVAVWVIVVATLVLLPLVSTALRSSRFSTSVEVFPTPRPVFGQERDPVAYLQRLLRDPRVESRVRDNVDPRILPSSLAGHVRITPFADHALVTVWSDTPERASVLLDALVRQLANASADDLYALATADLPLTEARLAASPTPAERTALVRRVQLLQQIIAKPPQALVAPPRPGPLRPPHAVDRVVNALPGAFPPRPALLDVVLVGLALAFAFSFLIRRELRKASV